MVFNNFSRLLPHTSLCLKQEWLVNSLELYQKETFLDQDSFSLAYSCVTVVTATPCPQVLAANPGWRDMCMETSQL